MKILSPEEANELGESRQCKARSRQSGEQCLKNASPFQYVCHIHGSARVQNREQARERLQQYLAFSTDHPLVKRAREHAYDKSYRQWQMRRAKKKGPEFVKALLAERQAEKDNKAREQADRQAARQRETEAYKAAHPEWYGPDGKRLKPRRVAPEQQGRVEVGEPVLHDDDDRWSDW